MVKGLQVNVVKNISDNQSFINDGQIIKFKKFSSGMFNLELKTNISKRFSNGTRRTLSAKRDDSSNSNYYIPPRDDIKYKFIMANSNSFSIKENENEISIMVLSIVGTILAVICYWIFGFCGDKWIGDITDDFFNHLLVEILDI